MTIFRVKIHIAFFQGAFLTRTSCIVNGHGSRSFYEAIFARSPPHTGSKKMISVRSRSTRFWDAKAAAMHHGSGCGGVVRGPKRRRGLRRAPPPPLRAESNVDDTPAWSRRKIERRGEQRRWREGRWTGCFKKMLTTCESLKQRREKCAASGHWRPPREDSRQRVDDALTF